MKPLPYLATLALFGLAATGCVMEVEPAVEEAEATEIDDSTGSLPDRDPGPPPRCGDNLVIGENGEMIQEPVFCDPLAERLPGTEHVLPPYEEVSEPIQHPASDPH